MMKLYFWQKLFKYLILIFFSRTTSVQRFTRCFHVTQCSKTWSRISCMTRITWRCATKWIHSAGCASKCGTHSCSTADLDFVRKLVKPFSSGSSTSIGSQNKLAWSSLSNVISTTSKILEVIRSNIGINRKMKISGRKQATSTRLLCANN